MKDILKDIVHYTGGLGEIQQIKITGTSTETKLLAVAEDKSMILNGVFKVANPEFAGVFGMPNLGKLKTILSFEEWDDASNITVVRESRDGVDVPTTIHFQTKNGDFVNHYRLMSQAIIEEKVKDVKFKGATWNITFEPSVVAIGKLKKQSSANSEETVFTTKSEGTDLKVHFGNPSSHSGNFVFHSGLTGSLSKQFSWPVKQFLAVMDLPGSKIVQISDQGVMQISVDSGITNYVYLLLPKK